MTEFRSLGLLLIFAFAASGFQAKQRPGINTQMMMLRVPVPDLFGQNVDQAIATLQASRLRLGTQSSTISPQPRGTVVSQDPAQGVMVSPGSPVNISVAQASPAVTVPNLHGQTVDRAQLILRRYTLLLGDVQGRPSPETQGTIVDQDPMAQSQVQPGSSIQVWIAASLPVTDVEVPDLTGLVPAQAEGRLAQVELVLGEQLQRDSNATPGTIIDQDPKPPARAARSSAIRVWLAVGPAVALVLVPEVRQIHAAAAAALIRQAGLRVGRETRRRSNSPALTVLDQSPEPGTEVRRGTTVSLELSEGPLTPRPLPPSIRLTPVVIISGVALAAAGVLLAAKFLKRDPKRVTRPDQPVRVHLLPEFGRQRLSTQHLVRHEFVVRLSPRPDPGKQTAFPARADRSRKEFS